MFSSMMMFSNTFSKRTFQPDSDIRPVHWIFDEGAGAGFLFIVSLAYIIHSPFEKTIEPDENKPLHGY